MAAIAQNIAILSINQTAVIMDVNVLECDKQDATLFQVIDEWQFFTYPHCNGTGFSNFNLLPMQTIVAKGQFHIKQGTELEPIIMNSISASIIAVRQNDVEEFNLETFSINTSGNRPNADNIQEIDFTQERDFIIPTGDCRNEIRLFRMPTLDITGYSAYEFIYPFKVRWEEWRTLQGANRAFPTPTQNWMIYANQLGWSIKFSIKAEVEKRFPVTECLVSNPIVTNFEHITWGTIKDPCDVPYAVDFSTYDITITNNYEGIIARDVDTYIVATINGDFNGSSASDYSGILSLDAWSIGGIAYVQEIGNRIPVDADGVWYGTGSTLMATLTKVNNSTMTLSAYINYLYLPSDTNQFILSASLFPYSEVGSSSGGNCLNEINIEAFTCGELVIVEVVDANTIIVSGAVVTQEMRDVFAENLILTFVTATTWTVSGGKIDGNEITQGTVGGNVIKAPAHPYTDAIVGDTIQGELSGTLYSSSSVINGIGDMQIGCTFFVS